MGKSCGVSKLFVVCAVLALVSVTTIVTLWTIALTGNSEDIVAPWDRYRLPKTLMPHHYNVTLWPRLTPDPASGLYIFTGTSMVEFQCLEDTDLILIHSNKLNYTTLGGQMAILTAEGVALAPKIKKFWVQTETQYLVLQLDSKLMKGQSYQLYSEFTGELADDLAGFYRSKYEENEIEKVIATSQMHPTHARKTFPCFDEPAMKAVFHITLLHVPGTIALSNGKEKQIFNTTIDGIEVTQSTFEPTRKMSSYLLALIVSDYAHLSTNQGHILIRIWARRKAIEDDQGWYALNLTGPILTFLEDYYKIAYPLSKSDQIALPDFYFGAMENWGLVTYRETNLLYDPATSSNSNRETTATIIAHELAHMWFGNLVTLRWWNEVWLNEGFASYVSYLGTDYAEPTWNVKDLIVLDEVQRVFAVDALASSHPLSSKEEDIISPDQISELFDAISYSKGAAVLRMLCDFISEPVFIQGLSSYLNHFAYDNTISTNLWNHLQIAVEDTGTLLPYPVSDIMNRWTLQMGFPVVTIETTTGQISQKHFLLDPESDIVVPESPYKYEWLIPMKWMKSGVVHSNTWLTKTNDVNSDMKSGEAWVLANLNVTGYYRVNYDSGNWERLLTQLSSDHQVIPLINRAQLVDDAFSLARAKLISTTLALRTTSYLSRERDYMPWQSALNSLHYFYLMLDRTPVYEPMQDYVRSLVTPLFLHYKNMTSEWMKVPDGHSDQYNHVNAIKMACRTGVQECLNLTNSWYREWMDNPDLNPIHPNLKSTVYCSAIAEGSEKEWTFGWEMSKKATTASETERLMSAAACTKDLQLLKRYLEWTLDPAKIRKQDAASVIVYISSNIHGQALAWDFVKQKWHYMFTEYGVGSFSFASLISGVTMRFSTAAELEELQQFQVEHMETGFGSASLALQQALERTSANIRWRQENQQEAMDWFTSQTH